MNVSKTRCEILDGKSKKEVDDENGTVLVYDINTEFSVPREAVDALIPSDKPFTDQFYSGDDTRLDCVFPIKFGRKIENLGVKLGIGLKGIEFEGATIRPNMKLTPQVGQYVKVVCTIKVYPTTEQAGKLDAAIKEHVDLEIAPMTGDLQAAAA